MPRGCLLTAALLVLGPFAACAQDRLEGYWRAFDPWSKQTATIHLVQEEGKLTGTLVRIMDRNQRDVDPACDFCPGELKGRSVVGMKFITGLRRQGDKWVDGTVVNIRPGMFQGIVADCEMRLVDGHAVITGWLKLLPFLRGSDRWEPLGPEAPRSAAPTR